MANPLHYKVSTSGQLSLPAGVRRRWNLGDGGEVEVLDLEFGVLVLPPGGSAALLDSYLPAETYEAAVAEIEDPDLLMT